MMNYKHRSSLKRKQSEKIPSDWQHLQLVLVSRFDNDTLQNAKILIHASPNFSQGSSFNNQYNPEYRERQKTSILEENNI